ncbi:MAG: hypothetical protein GKS01_08260 [Alphaproteobacteria bacterium]|nr:hypothetical protein [Alphaproteobacteria bacterium]
MHDNQSHNLSGDCDPSNKNQCPELHPAGLVDRRHLHFLPLATGQNGQTLITQNSLLSGRRLKFYIRHWRKPDAGMI